MLLSEVLPQLRDKAETISADLAELIDVREKAEAENETLKANYAVLFEEQLRIATLIEARKLGINRTDKNIASEQERAEELAARSASLNQLIESLAARIASDPDAVTVNGNAAPATDARRDPPGPGRYLAHRSRIRLPRRARSSGPARRRGCDSH